jgi:hypothetical protein
VAAFVLVLILIASSGLPLFGRTADQLVSEAAKNLSAAQVLKVDASYTQGGTSYSLNWEVSKSGSVTGMVGFKGSKDDVVSIGGKAWLRTDKAYWDNLGRTDPLAQKVLPGHWMVLSDTGAVTQGLHDSTSLWQVLQTGRTDLSEGPTQTINGRRTVKLSDSSGELYVTAAEPTRLVRVVYAPSYTDSNGVSGLDATLAYPKSLLVTPPTDFYDPNAPSTLPGLYTVQDAKYTSCDPSGCNYNVTVHNQYGRAGGQATVTVKLTTSSGGDLGSCTAPIPAIDYNQSETVSCKVGGQAWTTFYNGSTGTLHWLREADVHNPIWND